MAFPTVASTNTSTSASSTTHTVNLPASISSGDLLLVVFGGNANTTLTWPSGYTEFATGSSVLCNAAYRFADGTEGSTISVTSGATVAGSHQSFRFTGAHASTPPEAGVAVGVTNSATG